MSLALPTADPPCRWLRYNLRVLFVCFTLAAVGLSLLSNWIAAKHREERAREWMLNHGAIVAQFNNRDPQWREWWVRWLSLVLPRDCFYSVKSVSCRYADDDNLVPFADLPHVREISLEGCHITDEGLAHLRHLELEFVELSETQISDAGLAHLQRNRQVTQFWLKQTRITDASLPFIARNRKLTHLDLGKTAVSDAGVQLLAGLPELEVLGIHGTQVTPKCLSTLQQLPKLKYLYLMRTEMDDSVIPALGQLTNLRQLDLRYTKITPEGCEKLRTALPSCAIEYEVPQR